MTTIATPAGAGVLVAGTERSLGAGIDGLRTAWADYRTFRASVADLNALTDRQLEDVGIARSAIRAHARKAIYGK
jgi:uncharacterized protein YjiS (DUF1127 family)